MITGKMDFYAAFADDLTLMDLIEDADASLISQHVDERLEMGDGLTLMKLSPMAAASVQKYAKRIKVMPLLRQAREASQGNSSEVPALKSEVERMALELRRLRAEQAEVHAGRLQCQLCFDEVLVAAPGNLACPNEHLICAGCAPQMVRNFLDRVGASDVMLEDHRGRGGLIPCVRHNPAFQPQCSSNYTDQSLARALPDEVFVGYRAAQDDVTENRIWHQHNQRFQEEVQRMQRQFESEQNTRREEAASTEFLRRQYPNAKMCPQCRCGPVINENCFDLQSHHNEASGRSRINNSCRQCGFFTRDWNQWLPWDGVLRREPHH